MSEGKSQWKLPKRFIVEIKRRGGGLYVLIPSEIAKFLGVGENDKIAFIEDLENKVVLILKPERVRVIITGLGPAELPFSIPKRILEKIASKSG
jgi:antitoxin component of MazEF toxin-antitoxin module